jgi:hypothetical protein
MPISSLAQEPSLRRPNIRPELDYELLEAAAELAANGRATESLSRVFEHLLPAQAPPDFSRGPFTFTQGSSRVTTAIENDDIVITVPLVKLTQGGKAIAALRYVLTNIAGTGQLYQPRLQGDLIRLEYRDALARLHPAKVLEVLRKMPAEADASDDILMSEFGAEPIDRAPIEGLEGAALDRAFALWTAHWKDVEELYKESQRKRSTWFLNELTAYTLHRVCHLLPLGGALRSRLEQAAGNFNDADEDPGKREALLGKCIKEMKAVTREALGASLGYASHAINPDEPGTARILKGHLGSGRYMSNIEALRSSGRAIDAALALISTYNYLLSAYAWREPIYAALCEGLAKASGKPWGEAADVLIEHAGGLVERVEDEDEDEDEADEDGNEDEEGGDE